MDTPDSRRQLSGLLVGYRTSPAVDVAAEPGLAGHARAMAPRGHRPLRTDSLGEPRRTAVPGSRRSLAISILIANTTGSGASCGTASRRASFDDNARHPEEAASFHDPMTAVSAIVGPALLEAFHFAPNRTFVDVDGHSGFPAAIFGAARPDWGGLYDPRRSSPGPKGS